MGWVLAMGERDLPQGNTSRASKKHDKQKNAAARSYHLLRSPAHLSSGNGQTFSIREALFQQWAVLIAWTGGADSASGGSGGSGMECLQLRSPPGPFHYLISEQAKSLVALQELQNEVGALLEFRDLVIETFPNLRSKMAPSTPANETRRDWEPGVRVRRKLAGGSGDAARTKPQPSVQDSGFSTETSCGKDAHSSASASTSATRSRPLEDELWALLDVIQRKGVRLRDEAELLRGELDERQSETAEESFARALSTGCGDCTDLVRLRSERDALLARAAQLEAAAAATPPPPPSTPLGRLDTALDTPTRPPRVSTPDSKKFAAILLESNPVELQRQLLISTVQNQVLSSQLRRAAAHRTLLLEKLERARDQNEDLKFRVASGAAASPAQQLYVKPQTNADERTEAEDKARSASLVAEYVARTERLAPLFPRLHVVRARPLPQELLNECHLAYETPGNLALELSKSILYENADSIDIETLKSLNSHEDSLWNGKPQQYFESLNARDGDCIDIKDFEDDSLA
ncbi:jg11855 [Pararge aegeria aegeria]|uniref:Jg11855 protein n=1 Tax=Pararge aegeria aegeria TaxID=348720 RepID=A0A8S4SHB6_9NEOP|nr:jg11855 [Pararge aegeria aegeria]